MKALITLSNVSYEVGGQAILQNVTFSVIRGKITTLIGPNGAGKSTVVKLVAGLLRPNEGTIAREPALSVGYVPQKLNLDKSLPIKVSRFLSLSCRNRLTRQQALETLSITHLHNKQMHSLSGGELQRVLLAKALARKPDLLLLDEPLQGVDLKGQIELYRLIAALREELNCGILLVSHDLPLVMAETDAVICLNQHICCHGKPENVSQHPEYLKLFGKDVSPDIAVYTHHHDHHHNIHGDVIPEQMNSDHSSSGDSSPRPHQCDHD